jgi:hypothetical protein
MPKILRTFFIEPELDARLAAQAERDGVPKSELLRRYCVEGLERAVEAELHAPAAHRTSYTTRARDAGSAPSSRGSASGAKPTAKAVRVKATAASSRIKR